MEITMTKYRLWLLALLLLAAPLAARDKSRARARSYDWPQWRGVQRDAISRETGLLQEWPEKGPPLAWKATGLGAGYSEVSVARSRIFTMGERRNPDKPQKPVETFVIALDETTGKEQWAARIGDRYGDGGPRSTPTVDGDRVYALSPHGDLLCLDFAAGKPRWSKNLPKDFGGQVGGWHYSESVLIDGDRLICTPGGKDATLVALDKKTGKTVWKAKVPDGGDRAEYSSVVIAKVGDEKQYIQFLGRGVVGIKAEDGTFLWRYDHPANGTANCSTPVYHDGRVFAASAYGRGGGLARLTRDGDDTTAKEVYFLKEIQNHHGGLVLVNGYLYGEGGGRLYCIDFKSGKVMWQEPRPGKGSIAYADGRLYYRNEGGPMTLVEANPKKYVERGRFDQPQGGSGPSWAHPVIANGKLYLRHGDVLFCYDVKQR
jgi:outer membrane protein assembly factor BamB